MELIGKPQNIAIAMGVEAANPKARVFVVTLQNMAPLISQMSYEKSDKDVKLYFTLKEKELSQGIAIIVGDNQAAHNKSVNLLSAERTPETLLLERMVMKREYNQEEKLCTSALTTQDFEQTGANSKMLPNVIERLRSISEPGFSYGVTFEEAYGKKGLLWTQSPSLIQEYKQTYQGIQKGNWILWSL